MRAFTAGLVVGGVLGWLLASRTCAAPPQAPGDPRVPSPAVASPGQSTAEPASQGVPRRVRQVPAVEPPANESADDVALLFPDQDPTGQIAGCDTWPLERLLAILRAESRRRGGYGGHAGVGAGNVALEIRKRFPDVVIPVEYGRAFNVMPSHYTWAASAVFASQPASALLDEFLRFEREGPADAALRVAAVLTAKDEPALARVVDRWLRADDARQNLQAVECWRYTPSLPADRVLELARTRWKTDPAFGCWIVSKLPELSAARPDADPRAFEGVVVWALDVPELRGTAACALGRLGGRGDAAAIRLLVEGGLEDAALDGVVTALVLAGRAGEVLERHGDARETAALVGALDGLGEARAHLRDPAARRLGELPVPEDEGTAERYFRLLRDAGLFDRAAACALDPSVRIQVRRTALGSLLEHEASAARGLDAARQMLAGADASPDLRHAVAESLGYASAAARVEAWRMAGDLAARDASPWVRRQAQETVEMLDGPK